MTEPVTRLRFAELMACLAAACELAMGQNADHAIQACAASMRLAEAAGLRGSELRHVYYQSLLRFVGCNADNERIASIAGDVIALRRAMEPLDLGDGPAVAGALVRRIRETHAGDSALQSARAVLLGLLQAGQFAGEIFPGHCEVAQRLGRRLGFDERFIAGLGQLYARWDGKGVPAVAGEHLLPAVRVVVLVQEVLVHYRIGGWERAARMASSRRGAQFDPTLVDLLLSQGPSLLDELPTRWDAVLALEPGSQDMLEGDALDSALQVLADYAGLQSPWLLQHAERVSTLAAAAAERLGLPADHQQLLRRAGLVHDIGRVCLSAEVWGRNGALSQSEWDRVRLHSAHTAQILARAPALAGFARLAAGAHERLDGSGHARGLDASALSPAARVLAAADVVAALGEARAYRPAFALDEINRIVAGEVQVGRLDGDAAQATLACIGGALVRPRAAASLPAGLSEREAQVLGELARGRTNKDIARRLGISPKTVGHQVQAVYRKAGVNTRAGATLFAMEHGLVAAV